MEQLSDELYSPHMPVWGDRVQHECMICYEVVYDFGDTNNLAATVHRDVICLDCAGKIKALIGK